MAEFDIEINDENFEVHHDIGGEGGGGKGGGIDPNAIMGAIAGLGSMVGAIGQGKRNREGYKAQEKAYASQLALAREQNKGLLAQAKIGLSNMGIKPPAKPDNTKWYVIGGLGAVVLVVSGFFLFKKFKR